jgi:hypothetical protein
MGFLDVLQAIGGGVKAAGKGIARGMELADEYELDQEMKRKLGPDYEAVMAHQAKMREEEAAARPMREAQAEAELAQTQASTAGATGREERAGELFPGQLEQQGLTTEQMQTGEARDQEAAVRSAEQHKVSMAQAGVNPADIDGSLGEVQAHALDKQKANLEYQKALVNQIYSKAQETGVAGDYTPAQIARMVENAARSATGAQMDLTDPEQFERVMQQVLQAIELQGKIRGIPGVMKN